jgi:hypothetical protein
LRLKIVDTREKDQRNSWKTGPARCKSCF